MLSRTTTLIAAAALLASVSACGDDEGAACQQDGQRCGGTSGKCCDGLMCCSGVPVPSGQEYCAKDCPVSDRNVKYGFQPLDPDDILRRLASLPISRWTFKNEPPTTRHIGPMAQDFRATFEVGSSDRHISPVDADGVSLAAIQSLHRKLTRMERELTLLRGEVKGLRARCKP